MRHRLGYVTDLEHRLSGGGSYAVNWHAFDQLSRHFDATYIGPIVPRPGVLESLTSKLRRRVLGVPGRFAYFSPGTLDSNARAVEHRMNQRFDGLVFRSSARWCRAKVTRPYFVYLDAVFRTFFENTFPAEEFDPRDIARICEEEAAFLERATAVFFESRWGLDEAVRAYGLRNSHYLAIGRGGVIAPPERDTWSGGPPSLLTVAMNFRQKGGDLVLDAYRRLKPRYPALTWHIVGAPPEGNWSELDGIVYEGALRPEIEEEKERFRSLLKNAFLLVHPTREDTSPLVITEAAYFGCPSISVRRFAIPELVDDGLTGVLLDLNADAGDLALAIDSLLMNDTLYRRMRAAARHKALTASSWDRIGMAMEQAIVERLT